MTEIKTNADGITSFYVDNGRICVNLDFERFFAMTDDRAETRNNDGEWRKEGSNESAKKQKKLLKFFLEWEVNIDDIDDMFDDAIQHLPLSERLKDNQKEWFRITKRAKPEDKLTTRLSKMEYRILHEDAIVASNQDKAIIVEYYPSIDTEVKPNDPQNRLEKLHDRILDSEWKTIGSMTKEELSIELESSDTRFINLFAQKINRKTMKGCVKYIKDKVSFQISDGNIVAISVDDDTTLYVGKVTE